jgi:hypothetical protein
MTRGGESAFQRDFQGVPTVGTIATLARRSVSQPPVLHVWCPVYQSNK